MEEVNADEFLKKKAKGRRYAEEPGRFVLRGAEFSMSSEHDERKLVLRDGEWECSCDFFGRAGDCSHLMAIRAVLEASGLSVATGEACDA